MWSLNLTTSVENNATYITNQFVQFKLKNTCADIEDEAIEVSSISVVDDVDKCGVLCWKTQDLFQFNPSISKVKDTNDHSDLHELDQCGV